MDHAASAGGGWLDLAQRCRALLGDASRQAVVSIPDARPPAASEGEASGEQHLSVAEIFLPLGQVERNAYDYLCVLLVEAAPASAGARH
jgi:hypothetical protein